MPNFSIEDNDLHQKANEYIKKWEELKEIWTVNEIKLIKNILWEALGDELLEGDDGTELVRKLLGLWNWRDIPEDLDNENRYYIFESLLLQVRPVEGTRIARDYVSKNYNKLIEQYQRDGAILFIEEEDWGLETRGLTARRVNHIFEIMTNERTRNILEGVKEGWVKVKNE